MLVPYLIIMLSKYSNHLESFSLECRGLAPFLHTKNKLEVAYEGG